MFCRIDARIERPDNREFDFDCKVEVAEARRELTFKAAMIDEVNHRTKNTLLAAAGLLSLQARGASAPGLPMASRSSAVASSACWRRRWRSHCSALPDGT